MSDSEDSDGEGGLGNLNRMVMRPAGHSGKAKKGHLCFDASFETGNLGRVDLVSEFEYDLFVRPDTCAPRIRAWFNFSVDNVKQDQRVVFNIVNFGKHRTLYAAGEMTPIVRSTSRPKWQRILRRNVYYHRSIYHRFRHILSFTFAFDKEEDIYHFAMALPYSYSKVQAYLDLWARKAQHLKGAVDRQTIGKSIQKRKIDLITVGDEEADLQNKSKSDVRHVVFIIARIHGGESPSSFVCQGLMDFLISSHSMAELLRKHVTIKIIPMLNPDGVNLGNQKTNLLGTDLNRSWHIITQWSHPTLKVAYEAIKNIDAKKERYILDFVIDIHAHTSLKGCFIYGNTYDDVYRYERHIVFPKIFATKTEGYCAENTLYNADPLKQGTARRFFCSSLNKLVNSFTLQVSMGGYHLPNMPHYIHHNEDSYLRIGRNIGKSLYEYYRQINVIDAPPQKVSADAKPKKLKRKTRAAKLKVPRPKTVRPPPMQQCLEARVISPSIIGPSDNREQRDKSQDRIAEVAFPKSSSRRVTERRYYAAEDAVGETSYRPSTRPITSSPPRKLTIVDLNDSIRSGFGKNGHRHRRTSSRNKYSANNSQRWVGKKSSKLTTHFKPYCDREIRTSDEDYIDID